MRTRRRATSIEDLRRAIDCLPTRTKVAMLQGIETNPIIVGAYSTREGICPMLAAHRAGGRTDLIAFARACDRFALAGARRPTSRRATARELLVLKSHLETSLLEESAPLARAIAEHRELVATRPRPQPDHVPTQSRRDRPARAWRRRPGDPDRTPGLRTKPGWAWTRPFRRYDDYERERLGHRGRAAGDRCAGGEWAGGARAEPIRRHCSPGP